ncbi:MAG: GNAT family N-acetyltransferase [Intrasporangiaceae bacterium]|nr:GNAT family N-acetyltransferase [Intrasporangiaceae bacterium]
MAVLQWTTLTPNDFDDVRTLAQICLDHDGGLPDLVDEAHLRRYFFGDETMAGRDELGELVAIASLTYDEVGTRMVSGLVHPSFRRQGHGESLVSWARKKAPGMPMKVVAETMSPEAETLYANSGLTRTYAEYVMCHDLSHISRIPLPEGVTTEPFTEETAHDFFVAYRESFGDQPLFPNPSEEDWLAISRQDPDFRPEDSRVAYSRGGAPIGLVTVSGNWIDQVGVVPTWRGHRIGAHLVVRTLTALKAAGEKSVWLNVGVTNPSWELYKRLGFTVHGTRARYEDRTTRLPNGQDEATTDAGAPDGSDEAAENLGEHATA